MKHKLLEPFRYHEAALFSSHSSVVIQIASTFVPGPHEPSAELSGYIMLVNMPATLQIDPQTDGGTHSYSSRGTKVSSGM